MPIAIFKSVREVSSEDGVHVANNLLKENAGKKWRTKSPGEKSAYVILEFQDPQQITGIDIGNEHAAFIEVLVSRTGCQADDFKELLLSSSFMTPIESKNSSNQNRVRCFSGPALSEIVLPEKWKLLKIVCTQPFNRHVQYGLSFVKVHVLGAPANVAAPPKVKSLLPHGMMQFGAFKLREESPDSETDNQVTRFQRWKKETQHQSSAAVSTAAAIRDAGSNVLRRLSTGKASSLAASPSASPKPSPKPSPSPSPVPNALRSGSPSPSDSKPLDRNRASLLFGDDDENEAAVEENAKKKRLSKHIEADKERRRLEQEKEKDRKKNNSRHSLDKSTSKEEKSSSKEEKSFSKEHKSHKEDKIKSKEDKSSPKLKHSSKKEEKSYEKEDKSARKEGKSSSKHENGDLDTSKHQNTWKGKDSPRPSAQKRHSSPTASAATPAKKQKVKDAPIQYRPFNQLLQGVYLVISGIQNPDRADLRSKATALGAKYKADWEPGCTHLICAFKNTPKYNQVKGKGKIVTRSWIDKCFELKKYLPWRRYALNTTDLGQPESDEEVCDEAIKPNARRESSENDVEMLEDIQVKKTYDADPKDNKTGDLNPEASSGIDTEDELERVTQENRNKKIKHKTTVTEKARDVYDASTDEEDYLELKKKQIAAVD
ncbi:DNA repair protein XRCC1 [Drosophila rhopaloa]|uniref:DNA repair protein XRCC1 n=1 Tax=Drosophila rhopaloa TaxID=1041015 RepID=A0A6P4F366_DRORH|nr:DNA repair protein XRCC1 [Drosophila rhopaloa]